jgi:hypothetical protein
MDSHDVQVLDNVLEDTPTPPRTRRWLVERAALVAGGAGLAGFAAACGGSKKAAKTTTVAAAGSSKSSGEIPKLINTAITAEALAVTFLSGVITNLGSAAPIKPFVPVLKAANAAEYDHYKALQSLGAKPLTTKFWAPNDFFVPKNVFPTIEVAETLFVNAYLIAVTTFATAGTNDYARYAGEILGTEAEHRTLARFAQGKLPNDVGFEDYSITSIDGIVAGLEKAGVGFGKQGSKPGKFYNFQAPTAAVLGQVEEEMPQ